MFTLTDTSCWPDIIGVEDAVAASSVSALRKGIGGDGGDADCSTLIDLMPITLSPTALAATSAFFFALSIASFNNEFFTLSKFLSDKVK